ncbi:Uncharacterized protein FWK35_00012978 [Aphis craccivora]|uniref:Uncharacterized protein n=1 Tax=Aphis craccivora TaxID=307492 RepID=A0A6G0YCP1_APHCR|nr:Uncharacterized protein FWK35_00012978 [Aphis craccivora]
MDVFGSLTASRVDKRIADMSEKFNEELDLNVNLIKLNDTKIEKYFLENNIKISAAIESIEIINKNIADLKTALSLANADIITIKKECIVRRSVSIEHESQLDVHNI